jgi:hypothetical protein
MFATLIFVAIVLLGTSILLILAGRWLACSWEVIDDEALLDHELGAPFWFHIQGWLNPGARQLTYRRDTRGRFRRHRR